MLLNKYTKVHSVEDLKGFTYVLVDVYNKFTTKTIQHYVVTDHNTNSPVWKHISTGKTMPGQRELSDMVQMFKAKRVFLGIRSDVIL